MKTKTKSTISINLDLCGSGEISSVVFSEVFVISEANFDDLYNKQDIIIEKVEDMAALNSLISPDLHNYITAHFKV